MRLIDADKLPVRSIDETDLPKDKGLLVVLKEDIDNAPTIIKAEYIEQYIEGLIDGRNRPQGKWEFNGFCFSSIQYKCNKCDYPTLEKTNFCPNCGADMRGKEE